MQDMNKIDQIFSKIPSLKHTFVPPFSLTPCLNIIFNHYMKEKFNSTA